MIPCVVFRVLQETEPATFGDDALNASGFFPRKELPSGHNGISWTDPTQADGTFHLRYMTRTCSRGYEAQRLWGRRWAFCVGDEAVVSVFD